MIRVVAFFSLAVLAFAAAKPTVQKCSIEPADIVFVVDTSTSIWTVNFKKFVRPFISSVVSAFNIGSGDQQSRVGMVTFGDKYHHEFFLNDYLDKTALTKRIENTKQRGGKTRTNDALDYMRTTLYSPQHGARDFATKVVIVLTDGESDYPDLTRVAARKALDQGIEIFAIGVGRRVFPRELKDIASEPDEDHVYNVASYKALDKIKEQLINHTCGTTPAPTTTTASTTTTTQSTTTSTTTTTTTEPTTTTTTTTTTTEPTTTTSTTTTTTPETTTTSTTTTTTAEPTTTTSTTTSTTTTEPSTTTPTTTTTEATTESSTATSTTTTTIAATSTEKPIKDEPKPEKIECKSSPADIYFVLDVSSSLYIMHFQNRVLPFVSNVTREFDISPDHTRVGVVTFSKGYTPVFGLDEYLTTDELLKAISPSNIVYEGGRRTDTDQALAYVRKHGFVSGTPRKDVTKMVIVITDGQSYDPELTAKQAKEAKDDDITIFSIGVGPSIDMNELRAVASEPEDDFVFHVSDFDTLAGVKDFLRDAACKVKEDKTVQVPEECPMGPSDIMFVFESASKQPASRGIMTTVITDFATSLNLKTRAVRVGSLTDPCPTEEEMNLLSLKAFQQRLRTIVTNTKGQMYRLLKTLRKDHIIQTETRRQVAVLFMDDKTRNPAMTVRESRRLKNAGVEVYVVAVGDVADYMVYESASKPTRTHVIRAKNYSQLKSMKLNKLWNICTEPRATKQPLIPKPV